MDWLRLAVYSAKLLGLLMKYMTDRQLLTAGGAQKVAEILGAQADDLHKFKDTMAAAGKRFDDAGGLPNDIRFRD